LNVLVRWIERSFDRNPVSLKTISNDRQSREVQLASPRASRRADDRFGVECKPLHEGAEARYGLADDQILHLARALVGVESFRIREEACDVVVEHDAVAAEQFARPGNGLSLESRSLRSR
jgi:hypothetical protein